MIKTFKKINFPQTYKYSSDSDHIPLEFYEEVFPVAKKIDLLLGYFSSNAIKVLSKSFAEFIYNGGEMRIITNHIFSLKDKENLLDYTLINNENKVIDIFGDIEKLERELSDYGQHFFDCLKFLLKKKRLQILPVKFNGFDLAHCKRMILFDGDDYISTDGSINFTLSALIKNSESFEVNAPWKGEIFKERTVQERANFEKIFSKSHPSYQYLEPSEIEIAIDKLGKNKDIQDLLEDSIKLPVNEFGNKVKALIDKKVLRFSHLIEKLKNSPKFPTPFSPREYQIEAYKNWVKNNYSGIFAMATGTGKTSTSLNAVLEEYKINGIYNTIILVPTQILVNQWVEECEKFNFQNIFTNYHKDWEGRLKNCFLEQRLGLISNFVFISTYATYNGNKFQKVFKNYKNEKAILIADEAHNLGTKRSISNYLRGIQRRIGLSATPNRNFDEFGTNQIEEYFNSYSPNHTFNYTMLKAIKEGFLTPYYYFPKFIKLTESEMEVYAKFSERLLKYFDFEKGTYREEASNLLIQRKRVIHQAANKKDKLLEIISNFNPRDLKHTIVYVPEGFEPDYSQTEVSPVDDEDIRLINEYTKAISEKNIRVHQIIGGMKDRDRILDQFAKGDIQVLTAMKTLDEGVDIPATRNAIFCSSTGNPRQYIQRRGRILRNFEGKKFANVFDLIVEPNDKSFWNSYPKDKRDKLQKMEVNIFRNELFRVANFLYACENVTDLHIQENDDIKKLCELTDLYGLDIFSLINELTEIDKK